MMAFAHISHPPNNRPFHPTIFAKPQNSEQATRGTAPTIVRAASSPAAHYL